MFVLCGSARDRTFLSLLMFPCEEQKCHPTGDTGKDLCLLGHICLLSRVNILSLCVACFLLDPP